MRIIINGFSFNLTTRGRFWQQPDRVREKILRGFPQKKLFLRAPGK